LACFSQIACAALCLFWYSGASTFSFTISHNNHHDQDHDQDHDHDHHHHGHVISMAVIPTEETTSAGEAGRVPPLRIVIIVIIVIMIMIMIMIITIQCPLSTWAHHVILSAYTRMSHANHNVDGP
jgi:Flp pilus assembly protein TadB